MLKCGAAKACINPELPIHLVGYRADLIATGIHDDLHVAALYLDSGDERVALLTYDTITNSQQFCEAVQSACSEATGLDPKQILLTVSHSHSTPLAVRARSRGPDSSPQYKEGYQERVVEKSVEALSRAVNSAEDVTVHYNTTRIRENINRRVFFPNGQYFYQPKQKNLADLSDGYIDEELGVVFFRQADGGNYVATLVNYTAHPLTVGDTSSLVTADYPGVIKREIEESLGGVALFVNGACGNNHPQGAEAGFGRCERMGSALAEKALYHRWDAVHVDVTPVGSEYREIVLPEMTKADFARLPENFVADHRRVREELQAEGGGVRTFHTAWAVGPIAFVGVPGEITAELGVRIKWESPFAKTFIMFLATDHIGYIAHRNAYEWGGYEVRTSPVGPNAGKKLVDEILESLNDLKARLESRGPKLDLPGQRGGSDAPGNRPGA